jgi:hypothetical protein
LRKTGPEKTLNSWKKEEKTMQKREETRWEERKERQKETMGVPAFKEVMEPTYSHMGCFEPLCSDHKARDCSFMEGRRQWGTWEKGTCLPPVAAPFATMNAVVFLVTR